MSRAAWQRAALGLVLIAAIGLALSYREYLDAAALQTWLGQWGALAPLVFMALYAAASVLFLPGSLLTLLGGALFGPVWGTLYNLSGATLGALLAFLISRYLAADWVAQKTGGRLKPLMDGVAAEGWRFVAFTRLVPLFPFNLLNYALGLTRVRTLEYFLATFVFMLPGALAYTYLGYAGREALAGGEGLIQKGLAALALLALVAFIPRILGRWRERQNPTQDWNTTELATRLDGDPALLLLDVRAAQDFDAPGGHIAGALNIPLEQLPQRLAELETQRDRPLALICHTDRRSGEAYRLLQTQGFSQLRLVRGGIKAWREEGRTTT